MLGILNNHIVYLKYIPFLLIYPDKHERQKDERNSLKMQGGFWGCSADLTTGELDSVTGFIVAGNHPPQKKGFSAHLGAS